MRRNRKGINTEIFAIRYGIFFVTILATSGLIALLPCRAAAYQTRLSDDCSVALHWPVEEEIGFWLNENGCGDDLPLDACEAAVQAAFDTIQNIDCTGIRFRYMGTTSANIYRHSPTDTADGINLIVWYESWPPNDGIGDVAVAATWTLRDYFGEFIEFGIALNGATYKWSDDLSSDAHDVQAVITAQILYVLGLGQSDSDESILDGSYAYGSDRKRTPLQDDIDGLCYLAPNDPESDHWNVGCPADQHCEATRCVPGAPTTNDAGATDASDAGPTSTDSDAGDSPISDATVEPVSDASAQSDATTRTDTSSESDSSPQDDNGGTLGTTDSDGGHEAECQFNEDCVDDLICTDGKCVDPDKESDGGCGCRIGRTRPAATPIIPLLLLILCARILRRRANR